MMIKELLDTRIRPTVQEDGGDIIFMAYEDGIVKLKMQVSVASKVINRKKCCVDVTSIYLPTLEINLERIRQDFVRSRN